MGEEFQEELKRLVERIKSEADSLVERIEELRAQGDFHRAYRLWVEGVIDILKDLSESFERLGAYAKKYEVPDAQLRESLEYLRGELREILSKIEGAAYKLRERMGRSAWVYLAPLDRVVRDVIVGLGGSIEEMASSINRLTASLQESLGRSFSRLTQVVSVRMRERDLEVIDRLVDSGIFKSRSEAVAYFVRRGIESSKEWIERALEQARKIRELQESIRRELRDLEGESTGA